MTFQQALMQNLFEDSDMEDGKEDDDDDNFDCICHPITGEQIGLKSGPVIPFWQTYGAPDKVSAIYYEGSGFWQIKMSTNMALDGSLVCVRLLLYEENINGCRTLGNIFRKQIDEYVPFSVLEMCKEKASGRGQFHAKYGINENGHDIYLAYYGNLLYKRQCTILNKNDIKIAQTMKPTHYCGSWEEECRNLIALPIIYIPLHLISSQNPHSEDHDKDMDVLYKKHGITFDEDGNFEMRDFCWVCNRTPCIWVPLKKSVAAFIRQMDNKFTYFIMKEKCYSFCVSKLNGRLSDVSVEVSECIEDGISDLIRGKKCRYCQRNAI